MYEGFVKFCWGVEKLLDQGLRPHRYWSGSEGGREAQPRVACARSRGKEGLDLHPGGAPGPGEGARAGEGNAEETRRREQRGRVGAVTYSWSEMVRP